MTEKRCTSQFCITQNGLKGRLFTPAEGAKGLDAAWCSECLRLVAHTQYFAHETADMIRRKYREYRPEDLPPQVSGMLKQFASELINELGEELEENSKKNYERS